MPAHSSAAAPRTADRSAARPAPGAGSGAGAACGSGSGAGAVDADAPRRDAAPPCTCPSPGSPWDPAGEVVRWAAFSCLLVPVVLVVYGASVGGAAAVALGLAAVTAACRMLLRHSERNAARVREGARADGPSASRHRRRSEESGAPACGGAERTPRG
ncbi:hypothetical protein ACH4E8_09685 [Streptomyces sp. NPDC017979]|uniref:hypothetical protein n=1 Tax=Streptomyces sp. NPDC017979 TaxID=3365024 RepID=UPI0037A556FD